MSRERLLLEVSFRDDFRIEFRGEIRLGVQFLFAMRILNAEPAAQVIERSLRIHLIRQKRPPRANFPDTRRFAMPLNPRREQFIDLVELPRVEQMERVPVIELLGAGDQLLESGLAVLS